MINRLHRYIFKELLISISASFCFFVILLILATTFRDLSEMLNGGKLGFHLFCQLMLLLLPVVSVYAIPLAVLSGILIAFGRLSSSSEITAMKSLGLSLYQIASSVSLIAFICMGISALTSLHYAPNALLSYKTLIAKSIFENPIGFIQEKKFIKEFPGYVIYLKERDGSKLKDFWIWEMDESNRVEMFIRSKTGELSFDQAANALTLSLNHGSIERRSGAINQTIQVDSPKILFFENLPISLPLNDLFGRSETQTLRFKHMTFAQLMDERERILEKERADNIQFSDERADLQNYIHKNFSQAYSVFALAIIGVPLALKVGRKESYVNVFLALAVALGYHFLFILVSWFSEIPGLRSDLLIWMPNILFQSLGFWLFAKSANQ